MKKTVIFQRVHMHGLPPYAVHTPDGVLIGHLTEQELEIRFADSQNSEVNDVQDVKRRLAETGSFERTVSEECLKRLLLNDRM